MKYHFSFWYLLVGIIIVAFYEVDELFLDHYFGKKIDYILPIGFILLVYGASIMMLQYLKGNQTIGEQDKNDDVPINTADNNPVIQNLSSNINKEVCDELIKRFGQDAAKIERDNAIREAFYRAQQRLRAEISELGRRSNLNLVIGVITTSIAAGLLSYMVLNSPPNFESVTSVLSHYLPRFMLVIFIEVFSFFFLRLYRATLAEIRIYQTDLTALTLQEVAVLVSLSSGDVSAVINLSNHLTSHKSSADNEKVDKPDKADKPEKSTDKADSSHQILVELIEKIIKSTPKKGKEE